MKCFTPMVRVYDHRSDQIKKVTRSDDKIWQHIVPRSEVYDRLSQDKNYLRKVQDKNEELEKKGSPLRYQLVPCHYCFACQLNYSAEWASRILWECKQSPHNYFITLTYDEEHLPIPEKMEYTDEDGQKTIFENDGTWSGCLNPKDVDKFINSLRKYFERKKHHTGIKYFYCGEYGNQQRNSMGFRPHYHMILMNCPLDITKFKPKDLDKNHKYHWESLELNHFWGKGFVDVGEVEFNSAAYVARYCMKKLLLRDNYTKRDYAEHGKIPEFIRMSRRPGIGMRYYDENKEKIYENDSVVQKTIHNNTAVFKPPKAFDRRFKEEYPEEWEKIKQSREACAERNRKLTEELNKGISDMELLQRSAERTITKANMLKRAVDFE